MLRKWTAVGVAFLFCSATGWAQTWSGRGSSDIWSDRFNWLEEAAPANNGSANLLFADQRRLTPMVDTPWSVNSIAFDDSAGGFTIAGSQVTVGRDGIDNSSRVGQVINTPLLLARSQSWSATRAGLVFGNNIDNNGNPLTITGDADTLILGQLSGAGGLTKSGAGTLRLAANNTFAGGLTVDSGTVQFSSNLAAGTGPIVVNGGVLSGADGERVMQNPLTLGGNFSMIAGGESFSFIGMATLTGDRTITVGPGNMLIRNIGEDSPGRSLIKAGTGNLFLGANTYTGSTTVAAGFLILSKGLPTAGNPIQGPLIIGDGVGTDTVQYSQVSHQISDSAPVTVNSSGHLQLAGVSELIGSLTMNGGRISSTTGFLALGGGVQINAHANTAQIQATLDMNNAERNFTVDDGAAAVDLEITRAITNGSLVKLGAGTLRLVGTESNTISFLNARDGTLILARSSGSSAAVDGVNAGNSVGAPGSAVLRLQGAGGQIADTAEVNVHSDGLFDLAGFSETIGKLGLRGGTITTGGGTLKVTGGVESFAFSATSAIAGNLDLGNTVQTFDIGDGTASQDLFITATTTAGAGGGLIKNGAGYLRFTTAMTLSGPVTLNAGTLDAPLTIAPAGSFTQNAGNYAGLLTNSGTFIYHGGTFNGRLINSGVSTFNADFAAGNGIENNVDISIAAGRTISVGGNGLNNQAAITLAGGTLAGPGVFNNNGVLSGTGTIDSPGAISNNGLLAVSGGNLRILNMAVLFNMGNINLESGRQLQLTGGTFMNHGVLSLNNGVLNGTSLINNTGPGSILGPGIVSNSLSNSGLLLVQSGGVTNVIFGWHNSGAIQLTGPSASLVGGAIMNLGTIDGVGSVGSDITNSGTIEAIGGNLRIGGVFSNGSLGLLRASTGSKLLVTSGLAVNLGTISLAGGTFDNNGALLSNSGQISGFGVIATGGLTNNGTITFTGGFTTINGNVINSAGQQLRVAHNPALFTGNVTNNGTFKNTATTVTFAGTYTENGTFISDPADNFFSSVSIGDEGAWVGGVGDRFFITGDLKSTSNAKLAWNTVDAELHLIGGGQHVMSVAGEDRGISFDGYADNFAWGSLVLGSGDDLVLEDANDLAGGALYVHTLLLSGGVDQIDSIRGNGMNIYYHLGNPANAYLGGASYPLGGGGMIQAVPEPTTLGLWVLTAFSLLQRRRKHGR